MKSEHETEERGGSSVQRMVRLLALMEEETKSVDCSTADRALWHLLKGFEDDLPEMNDYFHKAFRQVDVTGSGHADMAIWNLLHHSKMFWRLWERAMGEKQPNADVSDRRDNPKR